MHHHESSGDAARKQQRHSGPSEKDFKVTLSQRSSHNAQARHSLLHVPQVSEMPPDLLSEEEDDNVSRPSFVSHASQLSQLTYLSTASKHSNKSNLSKASKLGLKKLMQEEMADEDDLSDCGYGSDNGEKRALAQKSLASLTKGRTFGNLQNLIGAGDETSRIDVILRDVDADIKHSGSRYVFDPNAFLCRMWHVVTSLVVIYIIIIVLIGIGFSWYKIPYPLYIFNYFIDAYCWVDMLVSFNTGYVHSGHLIMDRKKIAKHYLAFWFWIDLLANVPWEGLLMVDKSNRKAVKFVKWLKLPRLLRIGRLRKLMRAHARYLNVILAIWSILFCIHMGACMWVFIVDPCSAYYDHEPFSTWTFRHEVLDDLVARNPRLGWECLQSNIFQVYCQALHVSAAALLGVDKAMFAGYISGGGASSSFLEEVDSRAQAMTVFEDNTTSDPEGTRLRALKLILLRGRYPLSLSEELFASSVISQEAQQSCNTWYGMRAQTGLNTFALSYAAPMDVFGTLMLLLGLYLKGLLFANLTKVILSRQQAENKFRQAHDEVKRELELYGPQIPEVTQALISKHFEFRWVNQAYGPLQLLNPELLSHSLRGELALCLYRNAVSKVEFFRGVPVAILTRICLNLQPQYYMVDDNIYRKGEPPTGFYVIERGKVVITDLESAEDCVDADPWDLDERIAGDHFGVGAVLALIQNEPLFDTAFVTLNQISTSDMSDVDCGLLNKKSAFAMTVCQLLWLPLEAFAGICNDHPKFVENLIRHWRDDEVRRSLARSSYCAPGASQSIGPGSTSRLFLSEANAASGTQADTATFTTTVTQTALPGEMPQGSSENDRIASVRDSEGRPSLESLPEDALVCGSTRGSLVTPALNGIAASPRALHRPSAGFLTLSSRPSFSVPTSSPELKERVATLEQSLQTQAKKIDSAMQLIQVLLKAVPSSAESECQNPRQNRGPQKVPAGKQDLHLRNGASHPSDPDGNGACLDD